MYNTTELLKQRNDHSGQQKKLDHFFKNNTTEEFIKASYWKKIIIHGIPCI